MAAVPEGIGLVREDLFDEEVQPRQAAMASMGFTNAATFQPKTRWPAAMMTGRPGG